MTSSLRERCAECGAALTPDMAEDHAARQAFDLPEPQTLVVTGHRAHICRCAAYGATTRAAFPEGVAAPVQYSARITAPVIICCTINCCPRLASSN